MSTARASSVFLSSYSFTVLNQSVHVFALGYFLITYVKACTSQSLKIMGKVCNGLVPSNSGRRVEKLFVASC